MKRLILSDGTKAPSVTTIIDGNLGWNKKVLIDWYYNTAKKGADPRKINAISKKLGNLCHDFISYFEANKKIKEDKLLKQDVCHIGFAQSVLDQYKIIKEENNIVTEFVESSYISEKYRYGGRIDMYGIVKGVKSLIDTKTSKYIYPDHLIQLSSYRQLLIENDIEVKQNFILCINKNPSTSKEDLVKLIPIPDTLLDEGFEIFRCLLWLNNKKEGFRYG